MALILLPMVDRLLDRSSNHTPKKVTSITVSLFTYNDGSLVKSETLSVGEVLFTWSAIEHQSQHELPRSRQRRRVRVSFGLFHALFYSS